MQDSSVFRGVDVFTGEHRVSELLDLGFSGQLEEGGKDLFIDQVLGVVEQERDAGRGRVELLGQGGESGRVGSKQILEHELRLLGRVKLLELLPRSVLWRSASRQDDVDVSVSQPAESAI